jgi:hypothetical protein
MIWVALYCVGVPTAVLSCGTIRSLTRDDYAGDRQSQGFGRQVQGVRIHEEGNAL